MNNPLRTADMPRSRATGQSERIPQSEIASVSTDPHHRSAQFVGKLASHRSEIFGYLYSLVLNFDDAEDLYQQVALVLWKKFPSYDPTKDFGHWGIRVAHFTVKDFVRRRRRSKVLFSDEMLDHVMENHVSPAAPDAPSRADALAKCIERLNEPDRRLVESCYGGEHKIKEVAQREGRTPDAIYTTLYRIRRALLRCIERRLATEGRL
jgi:RNA polymerase sigma-70 factor, ECF subfamily